jgi:hypothetical protein
MAGRVPAIPVFDSDVFSKTWAPATSAGMTVRMGLARRRREPGLTLRRVPRVAGNFAAITERAPRPAGKKTAVETSIDGDSAWRQEDP